MGGSKQKINGFPNSFQSFYNLQFSLRYDKGIIFTTYILFWVVVGLLSVSKKLLGIILREKK